MEARTISTPSFDPLIHPLARLQMMALLSDVTDMEFATLRDLLEISDSLLSKHLAALGEAGYVRLSKAKANGRQRTWVAATKQGVSAFHRHLASLNSLAKRIGVPDEADTGSGARSSGPMPQGQSG